MNLATNSPSIEPLASPAGGEAHRRIESKTIPVSVIIPCYRCKDTIERAIESVAAQSARPFEVILVEDGSPDQTLSHIRKIQQRYGGDWLRVFSLPVNEGPGSARNTGWVHATQPYIAFLDADDAWHPRKLEIQYNWMASNPAVTLSGHKIIVHRAELKQEEMRGAFRAEPVGPYDLMLTNRIHCPAAMIKRDIPFRFRNKKRHSEDYLLWLTLAFNKYPVWHIDLPMAYCFKPLYGDSGLTRSLWKMQKGELDTFCYLYKKGFISFLFLYGAVCFSFAKFARRLFISTFSHPS